MDEIVVTVLTKWLCLVTESTTTIMESCPLDSRSSVMKSTLMVSHGASGIGSRCSSPVGGCLIILVWRHMSQVETYLPMLLELNHSESVICICTATACCAVVCFLLFRLMYNYVQ